MKALSLTVAPTSLREYATARGWVQLREALKDGLVVLNHEKYKPKQIVYPTNSGDPGYLDSVGIALARLAELEGKQISELVSDVRRVHEDTYRFRLFDDRKVREGCEEAHGRTVRAYQVVQEEVDFDGIEAARNPTLSVDKIMEVVDEVLENHGLGIEGNANTVLHADLRERLNKLIG